MREKFQGRDFAYLYFKESFMNDFDKWQWMEGICLMIEIKLVEWIRCYRRRVLNRFCLPLSLMSLPPFFPSSSKFYPQNDTVFYDFIV
jgi:hypothetical protein